MLINPLKDKLTTLKLTGMLEALEEQIRMPDLVRDLSFEDRMGLVVDREIALQESLRTGRRLKAAKLRMSASIENIDFRVPRGLKKPLILSLADGAWIENHQNILITGPTGIGKSYVAEALGQKACRQGHRVLLLRVPRLFQALALARGTGRLLTFFRNLARLDVLLLEDFGLSSCTSEQRQDLLEILDDRHQTRSTILTSQLPVGAWHEQIGEPTVADAIMDRLLHGAYVIEMKGESLRKRRTDGPAPDGTK